jgi:hypothetical protein
MEFIRFITCFPSGMIASRCGNESRCAHFSKQLFLCNTLQYWRDSKAWIAGRKALFPEAVTYHILFVVPVFPGERFASKTDPSCADRRIATGARRSGMALFEMLYRRYRSASE